jgi:Mrp family chromosome partitioning ATPase
MAEETSVFFMPLPQPKKVGRSTFPLVEKIVREMAKPLEDLARRVLQLGPMGAGTLVLLTGSQHAVGCSTVSLALATAAARDYSVLLIDGDLSNRGLSAALTKQVPMGWDDVLWGSGALANSRRQLDANVELTFLPLRQVRGDAFIAQKHPQLVQWKSQLRQDFDLIIVDGGSVWQNGAGWAPWVDVSLVVCDSGQKLADDWALAWDRLEEKGTHILGIIETFG